MGREELRMIRLSSNVVGIVTFSRNDNAGIENSGTEMFRLTSVVTFWEYDELRQQLLTRTKLTLIALTAAWIILLASLTSFCILPRTEFNVSVIE